MNKSSKKTDLSLVALLMSLFIVPFSLQAESVIYSEGFETGNGGYTHSGTLDTWEWGTPSPAFTLGPASANSGSKCWGTDLDNNVPKISDAFLKSPAIALPAVTANQVMRVRFFAWIAVDKMFDRGEFQVSANGSTWETKAQLFLRMQGGWSEYYFDITGYAGGTIYLRFRCKADNRDDFDPAKNIVYNMAGLYVDDIAITVSEAPPVRTSLFFQAMEDQGTSASCPWVCAWNGSAYIKDNDIYSTARGYSKEYTDYYLLRKPLMPENGTYKLQLTETDEEESYTDMAKLIVIDHAADVMVAPDEMGNIHAWQSPQQPQAAVDKYGNDVLAQISAADEIGYAGYNGDYIELDFANTANTGYAVLILQAQGFLSDSVMGNPTFMPQPAILVQTQGAGGAWVTQNVFYPRWESALCAFDLSNSLSYSKKVRLSSVSCHTGKYHLIDYAALETAVAPQIVITTLAPASAVNSVGENVRDKVLEPDIDYAYMASEQSIDLAFAMPAQPQNTVRDFVFISKGYYVPMGTYFIHTWDGTKWVQRDGWTIKGSSYQTGTFDLSLWMPDPAGEYKVRIWQDFFYNRAGINYAGLSRGGVNGTMVYATDLRTNAPIINALQASDGITFEWGYSVGYPLRDRWVEIQWTGLSTNMPPSTNPVSVMNTVSLTPTINWTYTDAESDPQVQYEVEVWTSPNGTGNILWDPAPGTGTNTAVIYAGLPLTIDQTYYVRVKAFDGNGWGTWSEVSFVAGQSSNEPPVAEAGGDRTASAGSNCEAVVTLDGTGSSDPNQDQLTYTWTGPFGTVTGPTPTVTLGLGANVITLTVDDGNGGISSDIFTITVEDHTAPVPVVPSLPALEGECSVQITTTPTAVDNCAGQVAAATNDPLTYTAQGTYTITWTYSDGNGNQSSQTQTVIVRDVTAPVPVVPSLPALEGECSVQVATTPTAVDNCAGSVVAATSDPLTYNAQGTYTITWTFSDDNGNLSSQTQTVIVRDVTAPVIGDMVPEIVVTATGPAGASVTLTTPTVSDNCDPSPVLTNDGREVYPIGSTTVTFTATDGAGNAGTKSLIVRVMDNTPPVITITEVLEGGIYTDNARAIIVITDNESGISTQSITLDGDPYESGTPVVTKGDHVLFVTATDNARNTSTATVHFALFFSTSLSVSASPAQYSDVSTITAVLSSHGNPVGGKTVSFALNGSGIGTAITSADGSASLACFMTQPAGSYAVTAAFAEDGSDKYLGSQASTVLPVSPEKAAITYTGSLLVASPNPLTLSAKVTQENDGHPGDLTKAQVRFMISLVASGGGLIPAGDYVVSCNGTGTAQKTEVFGQGVYLISAAIVNNGYYTPDSTSAIAPVYDPSTGFITGGGWIDSPRGAYPADSTVCGKINYGFNAKYQKKGDVPNGQTEFNCKIGNLNFHSSSYEWLAVTGSRAQLKGIGTINGQGAYSFMMTVVDGQIQGGGGVDKFRMKIWNSENGTVLYDSQLGDCDFADVKTVIGGGNIVIH